MTERARERENARTQESAREIWEWLGVVVWEIKTVVEREREREREGEKEKEGEREMGMGRADHLGD